MRNITGHQFFANNLAVKNEIKNVSSATLDLVISLSPSTRKQAYMRKSNPSINAKHKWVSGCAKSIAVISPSAESYHSDAALP
jgi:hypothetical protein